MFVGLEDVNSEEFDGFCKNPVIHIMEDQKGIVKKGGTMRLGAYPCILKERKLSQKTIWERRNLRKT